ncbi:MAG TPA: thioredoxin family protein [Clostridiales bacterium]|nr:thioredoxin family protein [Clostridiales bacterium]HQP69157.1 thioredoxin family protein [Clostridiales bacterium]
MLKFKNILVLLIFIISVTACAGETKEQTPDVKKDVKVEKTAAKVKEIPKVTFIELGSVNCVPCKMMQPIMKEIEKEYPTQVKVVFHDVWTQKGKIDGQKYKIRVIPTQVFLDSLGKEYFRHEGFFPKEDLVKILKQKGVK